MGQPPKTKPNPEPLQLKVKTRSQNLYKPKPEQPVDPKRYPPKSGLPLSPSDLGGEGAPADLGLGSIHFSLWCSLWP